MSTNLVIAAVPDENDRVWKVSSEEIPHLTILHLGDVNEVSNLEQIMLFVEHAANTTLNRFYLPVDHRGELGKDKADVLFFKKGRYDFKAVRDFRSLLLQDENIKTAYDASTQFETPEQVGTPGQPWIPHLTLGYPETPAKEIPDDQNWQFYDVQFNKIAVWTGDFEGPEWLLKDYWDEFDSCDMDAPLSVAMSSFEHHGVKGMHWGVRNKTESVSVDGKTKMGVNPTGTRKVIIQTENEHSFTEFGWGASTASTVKHAATNDAETTIYIAQQDEQGRITSIKLKDKSMAQADLVTEFMEHHGVKGMHWGVRNETARSVAKTAGSGAKTVGRGAKRVGRGIATVGKDIAFESTSRKHAKTNEVHLTAADNFAKHDIPRINAKYKDTKGGTLKGRLKNPLHKDTRAYRSESRIAYRDRVNEAVKALPGNASGTRKYEIEDYGKTNAQYAWTLKAVDVKKTVQHADSLSDTLLDQFVVRPVFDADGFITDVKMVNTTLAQSADSELAQTADLGAAFLAHVGVKGMHWGVRKDAPPMAVAPSARSVVPKGAKRKTKIKVEGGQNHSASEDAIRVAKAHAKLKKSGTAALSNQELQDVQTRLNLERNVKQLVTSGTRVGKGRNFVKSLTGFGKEFNDAVNTSANTRRLVAQ